jgi:phage terminase large subunit-like protein
MARSSSKPHHSDDGPDVAKLRKAAALLPLKEKLRTFRRIDHFKPYPKQREFLALGSTKRERLLMAANRVGKTETGAFEATCHLTGIYPQWWEGKRFGGPTRGWVCGQTGIAARDVTQAKLCGEPGVEARFGAGMIPKDAFVDKSLARGATDAFDTIQIKHVSGGISIARFKSYEQGRAKFQGEGLDWIWFDEEPPPDIYSEGLTRIGERRGVAFMTFTPLLGRSAVVLRFIDEPSLDRAVVGMTLDDIPPDGHIKPEDKATLIAGYPAHEREARARGEPFLGSGRIFTATEESISEPPLKYIPEHWVKLWGIDPGIGHPFGAALIIWDRDNDVIHVHHVIRMTDALPMAHAYAMKQIGAEIPVAYPKDAADREKGTGEPLAAQYRKHGLKMLGEYATWPDGSVSTEAGILEMQERMASGGFKVAQQLTEFWEEYRFYHRKDGQIVKIKDDILSAVRVAIMMKRYARRMELDRVAGRPTGEVQIARNIDFDLFTGKSFDE